MSKVLEYLTLWILISLVVGLWLLHALLCRLLLPCVIRWYERRDVVPTAALLAAAGQPGSDDDDDVKIVYSTNRRETGGGCAVCLEEYKDGERCATIVACNHKFHPLCVLPWLRWHHTCPLCRITV